LGSSARVPRHHRGERGRGGGFCSLPNTIRGRVKDARRGGRDLEKKKRGFIHLLKRPKNELWERLDGLSAKIVAQLGGKDVAGLTGFRFAKKSRREILRRKPQKPKKPRIIWARVSAGGDSGGVGGGGFRRSKTGSPGGKTRRWKEKKKACGLFRGRSEG